MTTASWAFDVAGPVDADALQAAFHLTMGLHAGTPVADESVSFRDLLAQARDTQALLPGLILTWDATPDEAGLLHGVLEYDADLYSQPAVQSMAAHYLTLLRSALAEPDAPVRSLSHTTVEEQALLRGWAEAPWTPQSENVVAEVLRRAAETPDAPALDFHDDRLSYAQLVERASRMAEALAAHGVVPEDVVGLALERSASLVAAMLAVMMSGAAYLPLDAGHPDSRLAHMVANGGAALVIADRDVTAFADSVKVFRVEELLSGAATAAATREAFPELLADQRACLLYTSGSTGLPKGVEVTHGGIVRLVRGGPPFELTSRDVIAQVANTSFDAATFEIWGALANGGRLVGIRRDDALNPVRLAARIEGEGVTVMLMTTALFHQCVDTDPYMFRSLRAVFFGGEAADPRRMSRLCEALPGLRVVNVYGPTECSTIASTFDVLAEPGTTMARVPIGTPIPGTGTYVLDALCRPVGIGVPGEMYLGGPGLARGYAGRPDLSALRFVPSPFGVGERLYRTGDIVRWREDGELDFLGRSDNQVKIRGVRIEPDEVAAVLATAAGVQEAVVEARSEGEGEALRLVAYVVPRESCVLEPADLRAHLAARLTEAMVPTWYVRLPKLPLTPHGKVDRRALPAPADSDRARSAGGVRPNGPDEEFIAGVWEKVLGVAGVGADDDFFALGGHSLLATRVVAHVSAGLGVELGLRSLFDAPTVAGLAARVAQARGAGEASTGAVPGQGWSQAGEGPYPLSYAQQSLWFLDRLFPGSPLYNVPLVLHLGGQLDRAAFEVAFAQVVDRHEALRTRLVDDGSGQQWQEFLDARAVRVGFEDLSALFATQDEREAEAERLALAEAVAPFDLEAGPLVRARLVRLAQDSHLLLLTMHHAVFDGWSVGVFMRDLGAYYGAAAGQPVQASALSELRDLPELPELPARYVDFAAWQRRSLEAGAHDAKLDYWRERLADAEPWLDLPTDHPRPAVARNVGHTFSVRLSAELTRRVDDFGRAHGATRFMVLLAVFQLLMGRYAQTTDVSVGSPVSGRTRPEVEDLVGYFVNTVVLRTRWSDDPAFPQFLDRVRETTLGAYENQDVPFERVVEEVKPPRDPSRTPLFQVMLAMQDAAVDPDALPGLRVAERFLPGQTAKFDLTLVWEQQPDADGGLYGVVEYDTALFEQPTVQRMLDRYVELLESALGSPDTPVSRLSLTMAEPTLSELEPGPVVPSATLHGLFATAASRWPDQPALLQENRSLSYAELDVRSSVLCAALRSRGIGAGDTVAVWMDRDLDWPVALLGILKAGAAYVPVDVRTPHDRFEHICRDAQVRLVLTLADGPVTAPLPAPAVSVADALAEGGTHPTEPEFEDVHPQSLAYILYTSGTTGLPKGVCVSHTNLVHTLERVADRYQLGPQDRVVQFAALAFDVAAEELFATLLRGGAVVLPPPGPVLGIGELVALAKRESVSVLNLPASYWHEWVSALATHPVSDCTALRLVIAGSERVDPGKLALWQAAVPAGVRWLNGYGPTETTITATVHEPSATSTVQELPATAVPIGRPLPGVRAHILDGALNQVPSGVPGDLYISGPGVTRGYLNDPARTARSFLPDPWGAPGSRMYATGDRARRSVQGELEFLGREDDQVKLRGFRIELGEIEAALASCPGVAEAAAAVHESEAGEPVLVGYVAPAGAGGGSGVPSIPDVHAHLAARLPSYMVPSAIITLDRLPKNLRGKIARAELPAPARKAAVAPGVSPVFADRHEETVARIWREVLGLDRVGADENFFEIGGQSLLIVRVQARLTESLGRPIPVVDLFRFPTVRGLAAHLAAADATATGTDSDVGASQPPPAAGSAGRDRAQARRARQDGISQARRNRAPKTATRGD